MITKDESNKIARDSDYINSPKHGNSLRQFLDHYPNGASDRIICKALGLSQAELDELYESAILKLREGINGDTNQ